MQRKRPRAHPRQTPRGTRAVAGGGRWRDTVVLAGVLACFVLSGFAALLYQTAWTREFAFVFGTSELAVAAVLAGYMGGLAAGAALAGRFAHRITRPVLAYGLLELGIAVSALLVPHAIALVQRLTAALFGGQGEPGDGHDLALVAFRLLAALLILLPPTALMGATLPMLARYAVREREQIGPRTGLLYATNAGGAVAGTLVAAFVLLPTLGLRLTVWTGVAVNLAVFLVAALLARAAATAGGAPARGAPPVMSNTWVLPVMLVSGVASFGYEILWTRLLGNLLGGSVYAFATMLASFLLGITLGSAVAARLARDAARSRAGLCVCQLGAALASLAAFHALGPLTDLAAQWHTGRAGAPLESAALAMIVLLPPALFIGATFPFAVRLLSDSAEAAAPAAARVYAWNTAGAIAGSVLAAFVLVPRLGFDGALGVLMALGLLLAMVSALAGGQIWRAGAVATVTAGAVAALAMPQVPERLLRFNALLSHIQQGERVFLGVGRNATVMILAEGRNFVLTSNGLPEARVWRETRPLHGLTAKWLTALPAAARPRARDMLVVGLGGGQALEHLPAHLQRVDVIELEHEVLRGNLAIADRRARDPLADPRVRVHVNDARGALALVAHRYDILVSQPSHPWTSGASHLYTREFFSLARSRLAPDGVFVQWIGLDFLDAELLKSLVATLADVFANVRVYNPPTERAILFLASNGPVDVERAIAGAPPPPGGALWQVGLGTAEHALAALLLDEHGAPALARGAQLTTDDGNLLQVRSPRVLSASLTPSALYGLTAPVDPLPARSEGFDRPAIVRRLLAVEVPQRIRALVTAVADEAERLAAYGTAGIAYRSPDAGSALFRAAALGRGDAAFTLLKSRIDDAVAGAPQVSSLVQALDPMALRVVAGWRHWAGGEWGSLEAMDPQLAEIPATHVAFAEANRLRVRWRLQAGGAQQMARARTLLDQALLLWEDCEDFILRATLALDAGDAGYALDLLSRGSHQLSRSSRPRGAAQIGLSLLDRVQRAGIGAETVGPVRAVYARARERF